MRNVSLLVAHGSLVWQVLLVVAALVGLGIAWALPRRAHSRRARRVRDAIGTPAQSLDESARDKAVVLVGTVRSPTGGADEGSTLVAATLTPEGMELAEETSAKAITAVVAGGPLTIEVDGQRVLLEGTPQVLVGSRETGAAISPKRARLALWELASELRTMRSSPYGVRLLSDGDRVRARGLLRHEPDAASPQTYRSGTGAYFLAAATEDGGQRGVVPVAFEGAPSPLAQSGLAALSRVLAMPACTLALLVGVGEVAVRLGEESELAAATATITPFRRTDGLQKLATRAAHVERPDEASLSRLAELDRLRGLCGTSSDDWLLANQPRRAAEVAAACGDPARAARAWFAHGDMARAAASFRKLRLADPKAPASVSEVTAYLATDDGDAAAKAAHALLAGWDGPQGSRERLACVVDALDARTAGDAGMRALESRASEPSHRPWCTLLLAERQSGKERAKLHVMLRYHGELAALVSAATFVADPSRDEHRATAAAFRPLDLLTRPKSLVFEIPEPVALEAAGDARAHDDPRSLTIYTYMTTRSAAARSFLGDHTSALARLEEVDARLAAFAKRTYTDTQRAAWDNRRDAIEYDNEEAHDRALAAIERRLLRDYDPRRDAVEREAERLREHARDLRGVLLLRAGKPEAARASLRAPASTAMSDPSGALFKRFVDVYGAWDPRGLAQLGAGDGRESNRKLWLLAEAGDGQALAAKLRQQGGDGRGVVEVAGPHLPTGRDELARWVRFGYPAPCTTCGLYPLMNHLASRRDAAVAVGDAETVREADELRGRLDSVLAARGTALVLHFLSELYEP